MENIHLELDEKGFGHFYLEADGERAGEMEVSISGSDLTVHHTEVAEKAEGKGFAKQLLNKMVTYARENQLQVIPLCPFVHAQFQRHPEQFGDVWKKGGEAAGKNKGNLN